MADQSPQDLSIQVLAQSSNFPQAGQLDWVALLRSSVSYPLEVCLRLQNADVQPTTVGVGSFICSSFVFPPKGQSELNDSLSSLKASSSLSKALWFGFGVKHLVKQLAETESGAFLVAICAALSVRYATFDAAQILRELCAGLGSPQHVTPSIHQWCNLVGVCSGSLTRSHFFYYFESFNRLIAPSTHVSRAAAASRDVARGLAALSDLSRRPSHQTIFVGGVDVAWLAAVAQCLLHLNVEIRDSHGICAFRSQTLRAENSPQAVFISDAVEYEAAGAILPTQRLVFVSSGEELLQERVDFSNCLYSGPSRWLTILSDTFPEWKMFYQLTLTKLFGSLLSYVSAHSQQYFSVGLAAGKEMELLPWLYWNGHGCLYHPNRSGKELLRFASATLPELAMLVQDPENSNCNDSDYVSKILGCLEQISNACGCAQCFVRARKTLQSNRPTRTHCLLRVALTVIRFLLILSPVRVNEHIHPSVSALKQLYYCTMQDPTALSPTPISCNGLLLILFLFTGRLPNAYYGLQVSAACSGGVCVFYGILKDARLPIRDAMTIEVVPGHILHQEHPYSFIRDLDTSFLASDGSPEAFQSSPRGSPDVLELVVEEVEDSKTLAASYRMSDLCNYTWVFLDIVSLIEAFRNSIRTTSLHPRHDGDLLCLQPTGGRWTFQRRSIGTEDFSHENGPNESCESTENRWSILTWDSWNAGDSSDGVHQVLDIDVYSPRVEDFNFLVLKWYKNNAHFSFWDRRGRLAVIQLNRCATCVTQDVASLWTDLNAILQSKAVKFDQNRKRGTITEHFYDPGTSSSRQVDFELTLLKSESSPPTLSKRFWQLSRRGEKK
jgi:hypothetical protein